MEPIHKLALEIVGWGATTLVAFLFLILGSEIIAGIFILPCIGLGAILWDKIQMFKFVWENLPDKWSIVNEWKKN